MRSRLQAQRPTPLTPHPPPAGRCTAARRVRRACRALPVPTLQGPRAEGAPVSRRAWQLPEEAEGDMDGDQVKDGDDEGAVREGAGLPEGGADWGGRSWRR